MESVSLQKRLLRAVWLSSCHVRTQREVHHLQPRGETPPELESASNLISDLQSPNGEKSISVVSKPPSLWYLVTEALMGQNRDVGRTDELCKPQFLTCKMGMR